MLTTVAFSEMIIRRFQILLRYSFCNGLIFIASAKNPHSPYDREDINWG